MQQKYRDISLLRLIYLMNKNSILTNKLRNDRWWISPLLVLLGLLGFIIAILAYLDLKAAPFFIIWVVSYYLDV